MDVPINKEKSMKKNLSRQFTMFFNKDGKFVKITSYKVTPKKSLLSDIDLHSLEEIARLLK